MYILVDYSNVRSADRRRGAVYIVDRVLSALGYNNLQGQRNILVRLYDGWYENQTLTRRAQQVAAEVLADFPTLRRFSDGHNTASVVVNVELAYSLLIDPSTHLWHTFRRRKAPADLQCHHPLTAGCSIAPCALAPMHAFFINSSCPVPGCNVTPSDLMYRNEQKLVDTMIVSDLLFLYLQTTQDLAIVSSDDDMWPAISTAIQFGFKVIHVHTIASHRTPTFYSRSPRPGYTEINL